MARRKGPLILIVGAFLALSAVAGVVAYRAALLEAGLRAVLRGRGVPAAALTVLQVGWSETRLADLALGAGAELRARRVRLAYDPLDLVYGRLSAVEIDGPVLTLDLTGDAPLLGGLQPLLDSVRGTAGADGPAHVPAIRLSDARIEAATPLGPAVVVLAGEVSPAGADGRLTGTVLIEDGALTLPGATVRGLRGAAAFAGRGTGLESASAELTFGTVSLPGIAFEEARLELRLTGADLLVNATLSTADGQLRLNGTGRASGLDGRPSVTMDAQAEVTASGALWAFLALPAPAAGRAAATVSIQADLAPRADWSGADFARVQSELLETARGTMTVALDEVSYPDLVHGLSARARIDAAPDAAKPGALTGQVELTMTIDQASLADLRATGIALTQRASLRADPSAASLSAVEPGRLSAQRLIYGNVLSSEAPVEMAVTLLDTTIGRGEPAVTHAMTLVPNQIRVKVQAAGDQGLPVLGQARQVRVSGSYGADRGYAGSVLIEDADVELATRDILVEGLNATLDIADSGLKSVDFAARSLRHRVEPPLIAPVSVDGKVRRIDEGFSFEADASGPKGVGRIAARGRHRPDTGSGNLELTLSPLDFTPGGAQPGDLFPGLADLRDVAGTARAGARIEWSSKKIDGSAEAAIENMSLTSAAARVEGLSLALRLDRLQRPGSPPGQSLRIARLDPGVPLSDLSVRFQVLPSEPPSVAIEAAEVFLAGGRFVLADVVIDPSRDPQHLPIQVDGLDLAETFRLLGVEGLSGEGRLSGTIPIRVQDTAPRIQGGQLTATAPGLVRVRSDYAKQALAGAGESADLLLRALEDFHYDELTITIDQPRADAARLGITMLGSNPDVLDGYPFRFNITLETDPRKLLDAVREAYRISDRAIGSLWMFGR